MHRPRVCGQPGPAPGNVLDWRMTSSVQVRPATGGDLESMLALAAQSRRDHAVHQPRFWRPAPDAVARQRPFFASLVENTDVLTLVATRDARVVGFVVATALPAPPVYDPGGPTCLVDDFAVEHAEDWGTVGAVLLQAVRAWAGAQGAVQVVVVSAHLDQAKRAALAAAGLTIASDWWVGETQDQPSGRAADDPR
jgi:GNAT superfamily N-acetyltransferase